MMKNRGKYIIAALLFAVVFCIGALFQRYTAIIQGQNSLFLFTGDYFRETFAASWPLSHLLESFFLQFYEIPMVGPLLNALIVTLIFLLYSFFSQRISSPFPIVEVFQIVDAVALACFSWIYASMAETPLILFKILLISFGLALVALFAKKKEAAKLKIWKIAVIAVFGIGSALFISISKDIRSDETTAKVRYATYKGDWNKVLDNVTPQSSIDRPEMMPYAFLAMGFTGELGDRLFTYPIKNIEEFDMEGLHTVEGNYFNSLLNYYMGNHNEAIHHIFQYSCHFPHGMTHFSLSQLIRYNNSLGNYTMVRKYAQILSRSPRYSSSARKLLKRFEGAQDSLPPAGHLSSSAHTTTNNPPHDLIQLSLAGINSRIAQERFLCYLMLQGSLEYFVEAFKIFKWERIPRHYEEALLLIGVNPDEFGISAGSQRLFNVITSAMMQLDMPTVDRMAKGTYWEYHFYKQKEGAFESGLDLDPDSKL
jgi:hypothetical protein